VLGYHASSIAHERSIPRGRESKPWRS